MKKVKILLLLLTIGLQSFAQFPDNTQGRLALLCKTWGFLKYHHTNKCNVDWSALLISKADSVFCTIVFNRYIQFAMRCRGSQGLYLFLPR